MNWEDDVVRATVEGAGPHTNVQLELLLRHLEACPGALPHIADAIRDMGQWFEDHAEALRAEVRRRQGGAEILPLHAPGRARHDGQ